MKRLQLAAEPRKITGKKVKKLRREGILPANVYGKDIKSQSLQLPLAQFQKVFAEAGETGVVDLTYGTKTIPVLIHNLHTDYRNTPLHADFFKVNLKEKVTAMVPVEIIGEPKAVTDKIGLLMEITPEVEVEALPTDLPEKIELNVEGLANIDDQVLVSDLKKPEGVEILTDPNLVVVKIGELVSKEAQEQAAEEAAAAQAAAAQAAGEAGAEVAEGEAPAEEAAAEGEKPAEGGAEQKPAEGEQKPQG
ncbi:MAG: 50S ribosomal protein L25 [Candidatus Levybacteria bacterium]|nr:50S ribosomal protein L25 [Candidatus Levybacteria bacterium]